MRGFSQSFKGMLTKEARTVMAADLTARQFAMPTGQENEALDRLHNVDRTLITETFSMASPVGSESRPCWFRSRP